MLFHFVKSFVLLYLQNNAIFLDKELNKSSVIGLTVSIAGMAVVLAAIAVTLLCVQRKRLNNAVLRERRRLRQMVNGDSSTDLRDPPPR